MPFVIHVNVEIAGAQILQGLMKVVTALADQSFHQPVLCVIEVVNGAESVEVYKVNELLTWHRVGIVLGFWWSGLGFGLFDFGFVLGIQRF